MRVYRRIRRAGPPLRKPPRRLPLVEGRFLGVLLAECGGRGRLGKVLGLLCELLAECGGGGRLGRVLVGGCCGDNSWGEAGGVGWRVVERGRLVSVRADISLVGGWIGVGGFGVAEK